MSKLQEITATFLGERHRFANADGDVIVGRAFVNGEISEEIAIKGQADDGELLEEQTYRFFGQWATYRNKRLQVDEKQFHFQSFILQQPHSRSGVITYLKKAGEGFGFGFARAARLWELYGSDAVKTLRESPSTVADVLAGTPLKLPLDKLVQVAEVLDRESATEGCTLDLMDVLAGRGFPKQTARLVIRDRGVHAARDVRRSPYLLMKYHGCGFKKTDSLYLDLGHPPGRLKRQALCAWHTLAKDTEGHTWYPLEFVAQGIRGNIASADLRIEDAIRLANRAGATAELRTAGVRGEVVGGGVVQGGESQESFRWLAEGRKAKNEGDLARLIAAAMIEKHSDNQVVYREVGRFPGYRVGSDGSIWSCWTNGGKQSEEWSRLKTDTIKGGYQRVRLRESTMSYKAVQVSHLVLECFIGPRPLFQDGQEFIESVACHRNGNPEDNSLSNLRWDTRSANEDDKKLVGTHQTGEGNPAAKLTDSQVIEIREIYEQGDTSTYKLSEAFGVSRPVICKIVKRELWSHV